MIQFLNNSPARNSNTEILLGQLVRAAAIEGEWVGIGLNWEPRVYRGLIDLIDSRQPITDAYTEGIKQSLSADLLRFEADDTSVKAFPSNGLATFVRSSAEFYEAELERRKRRQESPPAAIEVKPTQKYSWNWRKKFLDKMSSFTGINFK